MNCPDIETLISFALSPDAGGYDRLAGHVFGCDACRKNLEIVHETVLAEKNAACVPVPQRAFGFGRLADLSLSLAGELKGGFRNLATWVDDLIPTFDLTPSFAARGVAARRPDADPVSLSFRKAGENCSLGLSLDVMPSGADVRVELFDEAGVAVRPFSLTVRDDDSGETLLDARRFDFGAAKIRGVKKGRYTLTAFSAARTCVFSLTVQ